VASEYMRLPGLSPALSRRDADPIPLREQAARMYPLLARQDRPPQPSPQDLMFRLMLDQAKTYADWLAVQGLMNWWYTNNVEPQPQFRNTVYGK